MRNALSGGGGCRTPGGNRTPNTCGSVCTAAVVAAFSVNRLTGFGGAPRARMDELAKRAQADCGCRGNVGARNAQRGYMYLMSPQRCDRCVAVLAPSLAVPFEVIRISLRSTGGFGCSVSLAFVWHEFGFDSPTTHARKKTNRTRALSE